MNAQVPAPSARAELRLLCLLCQKTGAYQPVATLHPMPPRSLFSGRWPNATGERALAAREQYLPLGLGLYLSPALTNPAPPRYWYVVENIGKPTPYVPRWDLFELEN